jgi:hypothetical protein
MRVPGRLFGWRLALVLSLAAVPAVAAPPQATEAPVTERTQKLSLKPHRVKGMLLGYGYTVGEFTGQVRTRTQSMRAVVFNSDSAKTTFTVGRTGAPETTPTIKAACDGGQSKLTIAWITFDRDDLAYICRFEGGPADADFALALSKGSLMGRLAQPQRAAELTWKGTTVRAHTKLMGGVGMALLGGGKTVSYVITNKDGREIGALMRGPLQPTFYLPREGDPDREAAAMMALSLFFFADPADRG